MRRVVQPGATYLLGVDIGTQGSKAVIVSCDGAIVASASIEHGISMPRPGWAEHDAEAIWWGDFVRVTRQVLDQAHIDPRDIAGVGTCALAPDMLPLDADGRALRPGILYGIDTRAVAEIAAMNQQLHLVGPAGLTAQDVGPKIVWFRSHEPERWQRTSRIVSANGYVVARLTGECTIDDITAGGFRPFYNAERRAWDTATCELYCVPPESLPEICESTDVVGAIRAQAAAETGLAEGTPVVAGAGDFPADAVSTGVSDEGEVLVTYGTTMNALAFARRALDCPGLYVAPNLLGGLGGLYAGLHSIWGGMATSAALTRWFRDNFGQSDYHLLSLEASGVPSGSDGLIVLPYFSGERTPIQDECAQGVLFGLTLAHKRGHVYRALLEGIGYGLAHHLELMQQAGVRLKRILAIGGGTRDRLWTQIVSDVTGLPQIILGGSSAALGAAFLAGIGVGQVHELAEVRRWIRCDIELSPRADVHRVYRDYYRVYRQLYEHTKEEMHAIARLRAGQLEGVAQ